MPKLLRPRWLWLGLMGICSSTSARRRSFSGRRSVAAAADIKAGSLNTRWNRIHARRLDGRRCSASANRACGAARVAPPVLARALDPVPIPYGPWMGCTCRRLSFYVSASRRSREFAQNDSAIPQGARTENSAPKMGGAYPKLKAARKSVTLLQYFRSCAAQRRYGAPRRKP
jgi:hypothetical protein